MLVNALYTHLDNPYASPKTSYDHTNIRHEFHITANNLQREYTARQELKKTKHPWLSAAVRTDSRLTSHSRPELVTNITGLLCCNVEQASLHTSKRIIDIKF